ncbi:MAG: DUF3108 domain-containing protein [Candidatus Cloacimonetes bacterium]|nr:DUF3108 domain-containing protein [Candidatus Cloacimonadota bacterium]
MKRIFFILTLSFLCLSCGLQAKALRDGEKLKFDVKYGIVSAAEATLELKTSYYQGTPVWLISSNAKTYSFFDVFFKVRDKVESWWDKDKLVPYKFSKNLQEGNYRQHRIHLYDHNQKSSTYQKWSFKNKVFNNTVMTIPANTQDVLSAFYLVRTKDLKIGKNEVVSVTVDGVTANTEIQVLRREKIKTIFGDKTCLVIEPKLKGEAVFKQSGRIFIWLTDDEYKIPVKLESEITFGSFIATLKSADNVPFKTK